MSGRPYDPGDALDGHLEAEYEMRFEFPDNDDINDYWDEDPDDWEEDL